MRPLRTTLFCLSALAGMLAGCGSVQRPCLQAGTCGQKHACVASECLRSNEALVPVALRRLVLAPSRAAVVTSRTSDAMNATQIPFGREADGQVILLLGFEAPFGPDTDIRSAFLVLEPVADATPSSAPVALSLARILSPWSARDVSWGRLPRLSAIEGTWKASTWGQRPLRIDVTDEVRRWREHRDDDQGLALMASPRDAFGATYALGTGRGRGPVLDIYLR